MVALISKAEKKAVKLFDYMSAAMDAMTIDGDEHGAFCLVPSERQEVRYKVRFVEPVKREFVPHATDCSCYDHRTNHNTCKHMHIVNTYYVMIYDHMNTPIVEEVAPVATDEMDALVAQLEADFGLVEVAPVAKPKKVRRSAKNEKLIAELQVTKKVTIAQVRKACAKVSNNATKVTPECPVNVHRVAA